ncbi:stage II sporulation protein P [Paenibacillaceae bacterium WGS1546]|uniref:stage II sporulation protein P n=1 Tax=Cohnella sp. WGS1546 TaxID=3366810 RepID=UPI00372D1B9C
MKRIVVSPNWPYLRAKWRRALITGRAFLLLSFCSMVLFVLLGLGGMLQQALSASPAQSMKGLAASLSGHFFQSLLSMELPRMDPGPDSTFQAGKMAAFLLRYATDLNPNDPKSLIAAEMPGMDRGSTVLLRPGRGEPEAPVDHEPLEDLGPDDAEPLPTGQSPDNLPENPPESGEAPPGTEGREEAPPAGGEQVVFIYHSHNRESFYPELGADVKSPDSKTVNITNVGKRLADQLEKLGVGASHSSKDYPTSIEGYNWNNSYKYSRQTVKQALASNGELRFFFDIHRDSQRRGKTTATIDGKDYAQVYFIVGHRNPDWRENEAFANRIHEKLEEQYPGLSRGVWGKTAANGNGEYNQSLAPNSVLLEIGGVDNTLEECYRTADALAGIIAELARENGQAVKANASAE